MHFDQLRNEVEEIAAQVRRTADPEDKDEVIFHDYAAKAVLVVGQCLVGIFDRLDGIDKSLKEMSSRELAPLPKTFD